MTARARLVLLVVLTWNIPNGDVAATASQTYPVLYIVDNNLSRTAANVIAIVIGGAMWLCGCSSISSMGRMWYAFARDGDASDVIDEAIDRLRRHADRPVLHARVVLARRPSGRTNAHARASAQRRERGIRIGATTQRRDDDAGRVADGFVALLRPPQQRLAGQ